VEELQESGQLDALALKLAEFSKKLTIIDASRSLFADWSKQYGPVLVFQNLWQKLGLKTIIDAYLAQSKVASDFSQAIFAMVVNRLTNPQSKLGTAEWAKQELYAPEFDRLELQHYYRALDFLADHKDQIEEGLFFHKAGLFDLQLDLVFFDTTSSYFEGNATNDLNEYGFFKDHRPDRKQVVIGLLMRKDGTPIAHEVFPGNTADKTAFSTVVKRCRERFSIDKVIFVADRGMIGQETVAALEGYGFEYILGARMRRVKEIREQVLMDPGEFTKLKDNLWVKEVKLNEKRYIVCLNPQEAERDREVRLAVIEQLKTKLRTTGVKGLVGNTAYRKFLALKDNSAQLDEAKIAADELFDGKYVIYTNTQLSFNDAAEAYKQLWQVERAFRDIKTSLELRPMYHWNEKRIRGHIMVCFLAFYLEAFFRKQLHALDSAVSFFELMKELNRVCVVKLAVNQQDYLVRTEIKGLAALAFKAVECQIPPQTIPIT
jgi:transposase